MIETAKLMLELLVLCRSALLRDEKFLSQFVSLDAIAKLGAVTPDADP